MKTIASMDAYGGAPCVLAMGKFDGVHRGHQQVLTRTVELARERGIPACALTFDRSPLALVAPGCEPEVLTPLQRKCALIEQLGIDCLIVCAFTRELMNTEPEAFLYELVAKLHPEAIVYGENFRFGRAARGDSQLLERMASALSYKAVPEPLCMIDGEAASSSRIRTLLSRGEGAAAARLLGRDIPTKTTESEV